MDLLRKKPFHFSVIFSLAGILFLAITALYLSGTIQSITTAISKSKASAAQPVITNNYIANFTSGAIDTWKWTVYSPADTKVTQTGADNLRFDIPKGSMAGPNNTKIAKTAQLIYNTPLKDKADFQVDVVAYRPIVTNSNNTVGSGSEGIRFNSTGASDKEGAVVRWVVNGTTSTVQFIVKDKDGHILVNQSQNLVSTVAILRLVRVNKEYRALYKAGNDYSADLGWNALGVCDETEATNNCSASLKGQDGRIALFTYNGGVPDVFPKVIGRFDQARIGWQAKEGTPTPTPQNPKFVGFSDAFSTGNLDTKWAPAMTSGTTVSETAWRNLTFNIPAGSVDGRAGRGSVTRTSPTVNPDKNFSYTATMLKPAITGSGVGRSGISFASTSDPNKEAATIQWVVSGSTSRLSFVVQDRGGTLVETGGKDVNALRLVVRLLRNGHKYTAWYRNGDADADWVQIGSGAKDDTLGEDGKFSIFASNAGTGNKFPAVVALFDSASGQVQQ